MAKDILAGAHTRPYKPIPEIIVERIRAIARDFEGVEGCWEWPMHRNPRSGYGHINCRVNGKLTVFTAHRASYTAFKGAIAPGMLVCHTCDNRSCFNPSHLYEGTLRDNARDMYERSGVDRRKTAPRGDAHWARRHPHKIPRGTAHHASRLTEDCVREIRKSSLSGYALAKKYGVSDGTISSVLRGVTWKHVK